MSNLTIGKIVNNSMTLVLNSTDQDRFGEKIVTGYKFETVLESTAGDPMVPAGRYKVIDSETEDNTDGTIFPTTFDYLIRGATPPPLANLNTFEEGKYYKIINDPLVNGVAPATFEIFGVIDHADFVAGVAAGNIFKAVFDSGGFAMIPNNATAHEVFLYPEGTEFELHSDFSTLQVNAQGAFVVPNVFIAEQNVNFIKRAYAISAREYNNVDYTITIPNETSFPGKTRCLAKIESLSANDISSYDTVAYVDIPELAPQNSYVKGKRVLGVIADQAGGMSNSMSVLDSGTLCQTPFGKTLSVKIFDAATHKLLGSDMAHSVINTNNTTNDPPESINLVSMFPTTIIIRLLFLTNEDLTDF